MERKHLIIKRERERVEKGSNYICTLIYLFFICVLRKVFGSRGDAKAHMNESEHRKQYDLLRGMPVDDEE